MKTCVSLPFAGQNSKPNQTKKNLCLTFKMSLIMLQRMATEGAKVRCSQVKHYQLWLAKLPAVRMVRVTADKEPVSCEVEKAPKGFRLQSCNSGPVSWQCH